MRLRPFLLLAALATLAASGASAQTSVRDSVRMTLSVYSYYNTVDNYTNCGSGVVATWPNVLTDILGREGRYSDYGKVATDGMYIPAGYGEATTAPASGISVPDGFLGHNPQLNGWLSGPTHFGGYGAKCAQIRSGIQSILGGGWDILNGRPFRITEWYATYSVPDGTPIALFEWEEGDGLAITFDGGFQSLATGDVLSHEVDAADADHKIPVVSYAWDFGDGESGTGARPEHTYAEAGDYDVTLTVTDDDGQEDSQTETVTVEAAHLTVTVRSETPEAGQGDEISVVATIRNSGVETVEDVSVERTLTYRGRLPDPLGVEGNLLRSLELEAVDALGPVTRPSLAPGDSFDVRITYAVRQSGTLLAGSPTAEPEPTDAEVLWTQALVSAKDATGEDVEIRTPCLDEGCDNLTTVLAGEPALQHEISVRPSTIGLDAEFEVLVAVENTGDMDLRRVEGGELTVTSPDGASATVIRPATALTDLAVAGKDTLVYRLSADALGTLQFEVAVTGTTASDVTVDSSPVCSVEGGRLALDVAALGAALAPGCGEALVVETLVVTTDGDESDADDADNVCDVDLDTDDLQCTLRAALEVAATRESVVIEFDIEGTGVHTIRPAEALPEIETHVTLDAATQPGYSTRPVVVIDGSGLDDGLVVTGGESIVRGLAVVGVSGAAVRIEGAGGVRVEACHLGVSADGVTADPGQYGVLVDGVSDVTIGGDAAEQRNVIASGPTSNGDPLQERAAAVAVRGETSGVVVSGNYLGVGADGSTALGAAASGTGVLLIGGSGAVVGGSAPSPGTGAGNVIAGLDYGVLVTSTDAPPSGHRIVGNLIGTGATGRSAIANGVGVGLVGPMEKVEIGGVEGEGNVISGNASFGVLLSNAAGAGGDAGATTGAPAGTLIAGNTIGLQADGRAVLGNGDAGVVIGAVRSGGVLTPGPLATQVGSPGYPHNLIAGSPIQVFVYGGAHPSYAEPGASAEAIGATYTFVRNNYIGLLADGRIASGAGNVVGVLVTEEARAAVGYAGGRNVIGGQTIGVDFASAGNLLVSNYIGTDPTGREARPNGTGVYVEDRFAVLGVPPGDGGTLTYPFPAANGNLISGNTEAGVIVAPSPGVDVPDNPQGRRADEPGAKPEETPDPRARATALVDGALRRAPLAELLAADRPARTASATAADPAEDLPSTAYLFYNRIGLSASGAALPNGAGYSASAGAPGAGGGVILGGDAVLAFNAISGNAGDGVGVYTTDADPTVHLFGNTIGGGFPDATDARPNTRDGVHVQGGRVTVGEPLSSGGAIPAFDSGLTNTIWFNGRHGLATDDAGNVLVTAASFRDNGGLGIDLGANGPGAPSGTLAAPQTANAVFTPSESGGGLTFDVTAPAQVATEGSLTAFRVQAYASATCDPSGFGEGTGRIQEWNVTPGATFTATLAYGDLDAAGRDLIAQGVFLTLTATQVSTQTTGPATLRSYRTSEFSECVRLAAPEDVTAGLVASPDDDLDGPGLNVDVTDLGGERGAARLSAAPGVLYVARFSLAPIEGEISGSATAPDGSTVTPDVVSGARYWTVARRDLPDLTYGLCLDLDGLDAAPGRLLVAHRTHAGSPWEPLDTTLDGGRLCASGLTATGEFGIAAVGSENPVAGEIAPVVPEGLALTARPNPVRGRATVTVELPEAGPVRVEAFDALGRRVALLHDGPLAAGIHPLMFDAEALPAGVYVVRAVTPAGAASRTVTVAR